MYENQDLTESVTVTCILSFYNTSDSLAIVLEGPFTKVHSQLNQVRILQVYNEKWMKVKEEGQEGQDKSTSGMEMVGKANTSTVESTSITNCNYIIISLTPL